MIDVNAHLGPFAFRRLAPQSAAGLLAQMDKYRIEQAWVASAAAITYRNAQAGNEDVAADVRAHRDRLMQFAVLNPAYAGWRDDLRICHEEFGCRGLRLFPRWHHYKLSDPACLELVTLAAARKLPVSIPLRVEDRRQQSWLVDVADVDQEEIATLIRAVPAAHFIIGGGSGFTGSSLWRTRFAPNYSIEISLITAAIQNELGQLVKTLGPERLLFGTGMPFHYPDPAILKVEILDAPRAAKQMILRENARRLL